LNPGFDHIELEFFLVLQILPFFYPNLKGQSLSQPKNEAVGKKAWRQFRP